MKKYTSYIVLLLVGLLLGWFLFGGSSADKATHEHNESETKNQLWTCSMHPQIMQPEAGDCPICGMDLIPAEATAEGLEANQFKMTKNALALANIQTLKIGEGEIGDNQLVLSGKIVENENNNAIQAAHFSGRIEKLYVKSIGEKINEGQLIALVYSPELVTAQNELLTALTLKKEQPSLYNAVRNKLKLWKLSDLQIENIEKSKKITTNFPMYADVDGTVIIKMVEEGSHVKEGKGLFKIANLTSVWAEFDVFEKQIAVVKKGSKISITTNANSTKTIASSISFIDPILDTKTRTVAARAELNNSSNTLKPGMFVNGVLTLDNTTKKNKLTIPRTAVLWTGKRSLVYVKPGQEPVFEIREIMLGAMLGKNYIVISGLNFGEEIVVNGTFTVDAAAQLQGKKSMMTTSEVVKEKVEIKRIKVDVKFQNQLQAVVANYLELKNELVLSKTEKTNEIISKINTALKNIDMSLLKATAAHKLWMNLLKEMNSSVSLLKSSTEIKTQRTAFIQLSSVMINSVKAFGINKEIYNQFCPMANNDKGANWLSFQENIENPYFGDAMLTCGNVEEIIN
jgi:Cu(I)/Ag(I) efflux system membrane fusion protein